MDAFDAARWVTVGVSVAIGVSSIEYLAAYPIFADGGILSWRVSRYAAKWIPTGASRAVIDSVFSYQYFRWVLILRLSTAILVAGCAVFSVLHPLPLLALAILNLAINWRSPFGIDGAYQMTVLVATALFVGALGTALGSDSAWSLSLWFVSAQLVLSFFVAGTAKLISRSWRSGQALPGIMSTNMYGNRAMHRLMWGHARRSKALCWSVISFEILFPLVLILPAPIALAILLGGILFHASTALVMGLNDFFLSFIPAYPALAFVIM